MIDIQAKRHFIAAQPLMKNHIAKKSLLLVLCFVCLPGRVNDMNDCICEYKVSVGKTGTKSEYIGCEPALALQSVYIMKIKVAYCMSFFYLFFYVFGQWLDLDPHQIYSLK